ncbi:Glutamyl-tRNA synthetase [Desulfurella amilsii]|uniref:Glutamate--tRNA ligase n=1 Tax=Desulfurella amilsii TaxID=1562698 RepID=A0A1X4XUI3_9BACT|nr:glutamate--tRNA ligase [Desulfurella amilsii]OSS41196.1 Glutamyl-tRNA synthetase [Desulfurella amilsii]
MERLRFAPSPTGHLHIGGLRTALYNYLYAKKNNGAFILRIEDTDLERSEQIYTESILEALLWCGLKWDEIYYQSQRTYIYQAYIDNMLKNGTAYKCYCTKERLDELKRDQIKKGENPHYDGFCKNIKENLDKPYVVRINLPQKDVSFNDSVHGELKFSSKEFDDFILQRSDGSFMYNFTNVVDDIEMNITHVIRGDDHITNTAKQLYIYSVLNAKAPQFAHIPMILGPDKKRLSKRHGAQSVIEYKQIGFLPASLLNYLARLGWSHGDEEIFTMDKLLEYFDLEGLNKSPAVFDHKKLLWLNGYFIRNTQTKDLYGLSFEFLSQNCKNQDKEYVEKAIEVMKPRVETLVDLAQSIEFFCSRPEIYDEKGTRKYTNQNTKAILVASIDKIKKVEFTHDNFQMLVNDLATEFGEKVVNVAQGIRIALSGKSAGPGLSEMIEILGISESIDRIKLFIEQLD